MAVGSLGPHSSVLGTHGPEGVAARSCAHAWAELVFAPGVGRVHGVVEPSRFVRACGTWPTCLILIERCRESAF